MLAQTQVPVVSAFLAAAGDRTPPGDRPDRRGRFDVTNQAGEDGQPAEIWLYDEISWWGVSAQDVIDQLKTITAQRINLYVNSPGGDVFDALAIYQVLLSHPAEVHVRIDGLAASAASYVAQAGDHVAIGANAMLMIHDAWGWCCGNAGDMAASGALLDKISQNLADVYATRAGGTAAEWRDRMLVNNGGGTWYTGTEAGEAGLADEVLDAGKRKKCSGCEDGCPECSPDAAMDRARSRRAPLVDLDALAAAVRTASELATPTPPADPDSEPDAEPAEDPVDDTTPATVPDTTTDTWDDLVAQLVPTDTWEDMTRGLL